MSAAAPVGIDHAGSTLSTVSTLCTVFIDHGAYLLSQEGLPSTKLD